VLLAGARAAAMTGDLPRAAALAESARALGSLAGDADLEAWGLALLGNTRRLQGRTREALDLLARARALAPLGNERLHATIRYDASVCLGVQGDFAGAVAEMRAALTSLDRAGAAYDAARAEFGLGVALAKAGRITEAIAHYESDLERWRALDDAGMEAEMYNCLGCAYAYRGEYDRARQRLDDGLRRARDGGYPRTEAATQHSLGEVLLTAGDSAGARAAFERGLAVAQELGELWIVAQLYDALALTAAFEGNLARAEEQAHHAIALAQRQDSAYLEAAVSLTLGAILARRGSAEALPTLQRATNTLTEQGAKREMARGHLWLAIAQHGAGAQAAALHHLRTALRLAEDLGADAVCDIPARWDAAPFHAAIAAGVEPERLRAVLERVQRTLPAAEHVETPGLPELEARGFGPGTLLVDGVREVVWPWDKSRELFFLLLHGGPRRLEQVMTALWPETQPVKARASLHTAVYRLRKATRPELVQHHGGVLRVNEELVTRYDVREFERLVQAALGAEQERAPALLEQAVRLYTAPLLEGLESEWVQEERNRLAHRYLIALDRLIDAYTEAGRPQESIAAAELLLARDPLREDVYARVIRAYLRLGDRAAAQRQYERCAAVLHEELGIEPGPELQALSRRLSL
jgi:DNA-binding SARP family transcriptional activator